MGRHGSSYGRSETFQKDLKIRDIGYRILPRVFSTLEDFEAIEEVESSDQLGETTDRFSRSGLFQHGDSLRRSSTPSWPSETHFTEQQGFHDFTAHRNNRRRQSEGFIVSGRTAFGLVGYRNESVDILGDHRSGNPNLNTKLLKRENDPVSDIATHSSALASFDMMTSVALDRPKSYHSRPRKLSLPVQRFQNEISKNGKPQRNSLPTDKSCLQNYSFDKDTELQWERLVARAKTLQFSSPKRPEIIQARLAEKAKGQVTQNAAKSAGDREKGGDNHVKDKIIYEVNCIDKENSNDSTPRRRRRSEERRYSLKIISNADESSSKSQSKKDCDDNLSEKGMRRTQGIVTAVINEQRCEISTTDNNYNRRHSVAVLRPTQEFRSERITGYSTHGALEYAKMLLGKIQEEGKTKTKKERLEEMSKALKLVLEELNRIELPDRDLVSIFISLRAKIVNLRAEVKVDERDKDTETETVEKEKENETAKTTVKFLSKSLPRPGHEETTPVHSRRFSWC
ncbi:hypothetical protein QZH41_003481 [Actinostola sp. cb2023]|nr:hypothetical protein QZH41_003481 [Actinostola sp. cb2023]